MNGAPFGLIEISYGNFAARGAGTKRGSDGGRTDGRGRTISNKIAATAIPNSAIAICVSERKSPVTKRCTAYMLRVTLIMP